MARFRIILDDLPALGEPVQGLAPSRNRTFGATIEAPSLERAVEIAALAVPSDLGGWHVEGVMDHAVAVEPDGTVVDPIT